MQAKSTILIVDDEKIGRDILKGLLVTQGYQLIFAENGLETIDKARKFIPDLILLDVMMPDINGFEVCIRLRSDPILAEVPIIMITALDDRGSRLRGIEVGADDFISKPFDRVELRARIKTIIQLNRYQRLLRERNKFEWVVDRAKEGYLIINHNDEIQYANTQARLWLGLPTNTDDFPIKTFLDLAKKQYNCEPEEMWLNWPELPSDSTQNILRYLIYPEDQQTKPLWLQVDQLKMKSRSNQRYVICLHDVTDAMIDQTLKWNFHSHVGHKLRTPSCVVTGYLKLITDNIDKFSKDELQSYLDITFKSALRLQDQIQATLEYIELPEMIEPTKGVCYISQIPTLVDQIKKTLELDMVTITYNNLKNKKNIQIKLAHQAIELILLELLKNAKKFHPQQTPTVTINLSQHPHGIKIQVKDDGQSLSPNQLAEIWKPYYQAEKDLTGEVPGAGLGLSMISTWVWRVGGKCQVYNQQNHPGLVVELVLPSTKIDHVDKDTTLIANELTIKS